MCMFLVFEKTSHAKYALLYYIASDIEVPRTNVNASILKCYHCSQASIVSSALAVGICAQLAC